MNGSVSECRACIPSYSLVAGVGNILLFHNSSTPSAELSDKLTIKSAGGEGKSVFDGPPFRFFSPHAIIGHDFLPSANEDNVLSNNEQCWHRAATLCHN